MTGHSVYELTLITPLGLEHVRANYKRESLAHVIIKQHVSAN